MSTLALCCFALCLVSLTSRTKASLATQLQTQGRSLVLVGGGLEDNNTEVFNTIVNMAGGQGIARLGIVTSASADPMDSYLYYQDMFLNYYGAAETVHINVSVFDSSYAYSPTLVAQVRTLTGFFFGGGDQSRVIESMLEAGHVDTPVLAAIREQFQAGALIAGSSAGTMCVSTSVMITGGQSYDSLKFGAMESSNQASDLTYNANGGLGFFDDYIIDTHFTERGREGRMIRLIWDTHTQRKGVWRGMGIDENTALVITNAGTDHAQGRVIGTAGVALFDLTSATENTSQRYFTVSNVYLTYLTHNDVYNFHTHVVSFSPNKTPIEGNEFYEMALTSTDIFSGPAAVGRKSEFQRVAASIFDSAWEYSSYGDSAERNPRFRVEMSKSGGRTAVGYVRRMSDFHSDLHSYKDMYLAIHAV